MKFVGRGAAFASLLSLFVLGAQAQAPVPSTRVTIDAGAAGTPVSPRLYGAFFEDINAAADGGIYAELIQNRSFEFHRGTEAWGTLKAGQKPKVQVLKVGGLNAVNQKFLRLVVEAPGPQITNNGFDGISLEEGSTYQLSVWLRSPDAKVSSLTASLHGSDGQVVASVTFQGLGPEWKNFSGTLTSTQTAPNGWLGLHPDQAGTTDLDLVSLFPTQTYRGRPNGLRTDLARTVEGLSPRFLRFPGGCVVQGKTLATAYRWKDTLGDLAARKTNDNFWGYYQSYGLGFHEYFQWAEDLGAEPLPCLNVGMAFQDSNELVPMKDLGPWIQDALDLVEYANGDVSTPWGAKRAANGHPKPFGMKYLEIGNEQWGEAYFQRYQAFAQALKAKNPEIQLILSSGPLDSGPIFDDAWAHTKTLPVDLVDEHYYMTPEWFLANSRRYDSYDRHGPQVFLGEYAAMTAGKRNNLYAALAEAAFMTGLERNGDVVSLASYAPLMAKEGATQWEPDLIRFNNQSVFGTPSYYVQQMFSQTLTKTTLPTRVALAAEKPVDTSVAGGIGLGTWATQVDYKDLKVTSADAQVLYQPRFDRVPEGWTPGQGTWNAARGVLSQGAEGTDCRIIYGSEDWKGITLSVKAKKKAGAEGMLILFGVQGDQYYWWNLGGWGNTLSAIEKGAGTSRSIVGPGVPLTIDTNRWYDLRVELKGGRIRCFLNNKLVHDFQVPGAPERFFVHAGRAADGSVVVKAVNLDDQPRTVRLTFDQAPAFVGTGSAVILSGPSLEAENTFRQPTLVASRKAAVDQVGPTMDYTLEARSVTVLTLPVRSRP